MTNFQRSILVLFTLVIVIFCASDGMVRWAEWMHEPTGMNFLRMCVYGFAAVVFVILTVMAFRDKSTDQPEIQIVP